MKSPDRDLETAQKIKRTALVLATAVSATFVKAPDVNAVNLPQIPEGSQPNRILINSREPQPHIIEIQYPQYKEVVIVTLPPTDENPKPVSFYAEVLEPVDGQKTKVEHLGWYDQGVRKEGLMGEEYITPLVSQELKIDFAEDGNSIDCRIVATKMNEDGKVEVEIVWINQFLKHEERGWVGIEKLISKGGKGGPEESQQEIVANNQPMIKRFDFPYIMGLSLQKLNCCRISDEGNLSFIEPNHQVAWVLGEAEGYPKEAMERVIFFHRTGFDNGVEKIKVGQKVIIYYDWVASIQKEGFVEEIKIIQAEDQIKIFQKVAEDKDMVAFLTCHPKDDPTAPQRMVFITRIINKDADK